ncbi:MAG: hypothetical protein FP814_09740 [Desulfobacterium sp.]|nr:hypothetical protein [Desulfobacteraceae bacterium]MBA3036762.1 hypothetical protein [Desulfobacterium sp.]
MNRELAEMRGHLVEKEEQLKTLALSIRGLVASVRSALSPYVEIDDLSCDVAAQQAVELAEKQIRYKELASEIKALHNALGR